jgi:hypothetical protein
MEINKWRLCEWYPALRAAGLEQRGIYTMRHWFATWAIEAGSIPLPQLATIMGTSIRVRMRGLEPPRGSPASGGSWRAVANSA